MIEQFTWKNCILVLAAALALGGCDDALQDPDERRDLDVRGESGVPELSGDQREFTGSNALELTQAPLAAESGWTPFTSEEGPPILCEGKSMVNGFACSGKFCDDVRMYCQLTAHTGSDDSDWTPHFSEEGHGFQSCTAGAWMVGLQCSGKYCDNISLQCRSFPGTEHNDCRWTGWHSEEDGDLMFGPNQYAVGVKCDGKFCDNKNYHVCSP